MSAHACGVSCRLWTWCCSIIFLGLLLFSPEANAQVKLGDIDGDGEITVLDLVRAINHFVGTERLGNEPAVFADVNQDGVVNEEDINRIVDAILQLREMPELPLARIRETSPANNASEVSVTRETIIRFTQPLSTNTVLTRTNFYAEFAGQKLITRIELSTDRRAITLFYQYPLPGNSRVRVTLNGNSIYDFAGRLLDADGDGQPGGAATIEFDTLSQTPLPNTIVCGRVFASELATNQAGGTNISVNTALAGITVTADGLENQVRAVTDQNGNFRLTNAPPGHFFVHVDGRTLTNLAQGIRWPDLRYYPYVGKEWESIPGHETNIGEVFLPLITAGTLQPVSATNDTVVTFPGGLLAQHPELEGVAVTVPANALFSDNGTRGGKVGIAPVPADRLPGPLPDGLSFPLVITLQTDGPANFGQPVPVCFPNLSNTITGQPPLPAGAKSSLWSFNHDTGQWEVVGPMTVSDDGRLVCSDPGVGILAPGWHSTGPGDPGGGGPNCPTCDPGDPNPGDKCNSAAMSCGGGEGNDGSGEPKDCKTNPILLYSGEKYERVIDLQIKGVGMDFVWQRSYGSQSKASSAQGNNWDFSYNLFVMQAGTSIQVCNGAGRDDTYRPAVARAAVWVRNGFFQDLVLTNTSYTMVGADGRTLNFLPLDGSPAAGKIGSIVDRNGNSLRFTYDVSGRLWKIADTLDRDILISYNPDGFISAVTDFAGRSVRYSYYGPNDADGGFGDLKAVTTPAVTGTPNGNDFPNGKTTTYTYSKGFADDRLNHNLLTITDGRRNDPTDATYGQGPYLVNLYSTDTNPGDLVFDRVVRQIRGGDVIDLTYLSQTPSPENNNAVIKVILNDRVGNVSEHFYDVGNRLVLLREFTGRADPRQPTTEVANRPANSLRTNDPPYFETRYRHNADSKATNVVHPNGNITEYTYEADLNPSAPTRSRGNLRMVRHLPGSYAPAGDQAGIVEQYEYDAGFGCPACGFNFVTRQTDARGHVMLMQYDERGNLLARTNRIASVVENFTWNGRGQMISHTLPDNGSGHRRVDVYNYYDSGPQRGYLSDEVVDAGGFNLTTRYEYDLVGNVVRKVAPRGQDTLYTVNAFDQVVREISAEVLPGSGVRYSKDFFYDANNNLVRVEVQNRAALEDGGGMVATNPTWTTTYDYEVLNYLIRKSEEVEPGRFAITEYAYDGNRNRTLTRFGEATAGRQSNNVVRMLYDERDLPFREMRGAGSADQATTQFDYDGNRNRIRIWHGLEETPHLTVNGYDSFERLVSTTDPMGNVTSHQYDANGNRIRTLVTGELEDQPGGAGNIRLSETSWTYDDMNRRVRQDIAFFNATNQAPIGDGFATTQTIYSDNSKVVAVINDNNHGRTNRYDSADRLQSVTDAKGNVIAYEYDADSNPARMIETEKPDLGGPDEVFTTTYGYDQLNRFISTTDNIGNLSRSGYDSRNNRTITIDANTNVVRYVFDGVNRLSATIREMTASGAGGSPVVGTITTRQTWDDSGRLTSQIDDNGNATTYVYDPLNRKTTTIYADLTGQTNSFDVHHNAIRFTDANGNAVASRYDSLNRVTNKLVNVGPTVASTTSFERFRYDGLSRLVTASNDVSLVTRSYDSLGHVTREVQALTTSVPAVLGSIYDGVGSLIQLNYPGGRVFMTLYDELERKKVISDTNGMIAAYYFLGPQRVARRDYGNGTRCDYTYDGATDAQNGPNDHGVKHVTRTSHYRITDASIIDDRTYAWDRAGNKTQNKDVRSDGPQSQRDYSYDSVHRLTNSILRIGSGIAQMITYNLDGVGNRSSVIGGTNAGIYRMDSTVPEPADRQLNQYTSTASDTRINDRNGNLIGNNLGQRIAYDYRNRIVAFTNSVTGFSATYAYDVFGRRVQKLVGSPIVQTIRFLHYGWQEIEERDGVDTSQATYVFGNFIDEVLSMRRTGTNVHYHADQLYSVVALSDVNGAVAERYETGDFGLPLISDPFGNVYQESRVGNVVVFTGRRYDTESGFYFFRTRYLDGYAGRFTARDTFGIWSDRLNIGNGFTYVGNSSPVFVDPFGRESSDTTPPMCLFGTDKPKMPIPSSKPDPQPQDPHDPCWESCKGSLICMSMCKPRNVPTFDPSRLHDQIGPAPPADPGSIRNPTNGQSQEQWDYNRWLSERYGDYYSSWSDPNFLIWQQEQEEFQRRWIEWTEY